VLPNICKNIALPGASQYLQDHFFEDSKIMPTYHSHKSNINVHEDNCVVLVKEYGWENDVLREKPISLPVFP
jgi:hypothetical protein